MSLNRNKTQLCNYVFCNCHKTYWQQQVPYRSYIDTLTNMTVEVQIVHFAKYRFLNPQSTDFSIRKVQISQSAKYRFFNSQSTDFSIRKGDRFLNPQSTDFSIRKVQISHFAKYRFFNSQSIDFAKYKFAKCNKPF